MAQLYFRQLLGGRDFGRSNPAAAQMQNFVYLIGDRDTRECMIVDPAWAVQDLVNVAAEDGMTVTGALATHYHPDHVGGTMFGFTVEGAAALVGSVGCKIHCHRLEVAGIKKVTGLSSSDLVGHDSGDRVKIGGIEVDLLHTPGHTPGSLCFRLKNAIVAGDTLFLNGCGRVDLPGGDSEEMFRTLHERLGSLPGDTVLYPGHNYGGASAEMDAVRRNNVYLQVPDIHAWRRLRG